MKPSFRPDFIGVAFIEVLLYLVLGGSLTLAGSERSVTFLAFTPSGLQLHGCALQSIFDKNANDTPISGHLISDMSVKSINNGDYRVTYECGSFSYVDGSVHLKGDLQLVVLVDRSGGDSFKFTEAYPIGLRIQMDPESRVTKALDSSLWVRVAYVIDGEGWTRLAGRADGVAQFPAKPGYYIVTYSKNTTSICSHLIDITSWSSSLTVGVSGRCEVTPLSGVRQIGESVEYSVPQPTAPE